MPRLPSTLRGRVAGASAVLLAVGCLTALIGPVFSRGLDRNQQCVSNLAQISHGVLAYAQDYDERLPQPVAFSSIANFKSLVGIYVTGPNAPNADNVYRCPDNGNAYYTLNTALGGTILAQFSDYYTVEVARDSKPHPNGYPNIGYLDGHAEQNGVNQTATDVSCRQNMQQITGAFSLYTQDYDEHFPFQPNDADFRQSLLPYTKTNRVFVCPDTQQFYKINRDIRGMTFAAIPDPSPIILFQDAIPHKNGIVTTSYLDGYLEQRGPNGNVLYPSPIPAPQMSLNNVKLLSGAMLQYEQDYDDRLPLYNNYPDLLQALTPYVDYHSGSRGLQQLKQPTFQADPMFSGIDISSIPDPHDTIYLRDIQDFGDGLITAGYLDGHAARIPRPTRKTITAPKPGRGGK